eukprot:365124-Chlamydomonas_euryale.AAC.19
MPASATAAVGAAAPSRDGKAARMGRPRQVAQAEELSSQAWAQLGGGCLQARVWVRRVPDNAAVLGLGRGASDARVFVYGEDPVSGRLPGRAVDPAVGLANGALCDDCDLAASGLKVDACGNTSVTITVTVGGGGRCVCVCVPVCVRRHQRDNNSNSGGRGTVCVCVPVCVRCMPDNGIGTTRAMRPRAGRAAACTRFSALRTWIQWVVGPTSSGSN